MAWWYASELIASQSQSQSLAFSNRRIRIATFVARSAKQSQKIAEWNRKSQRFEIANSESQRFFVFWVFFSYKQCRSSGAFAGMGAGNFCWFTYKTTKTMKLQASSAILWNCYFQTQLHVLHCSRHARCSLRKVIDDAKSAHLSLAEEKKSISGAQIFKRNRSVFFRLRLQIAAFSRFREPCLHAPSPRLFFSHRPCN